MIPGCSEWQPIQSAFKIVVPGSINMVCVEGSICVDATRVYNSRIATPAVPYIATRFLSTSPDSLDGSDILAGVSDNWGSMIGCFRF